MDNDYAARSACKGILLKEIKEGLPAVSFDDVGKHIALIPRLLAGAWRIHVEQSRVELAGINSGCIPTEIEVPGR